MSSLAGETECPEGGRKRHTPQTGPRASTGPRRFSAVPRAVLLLTNSGRRFHHTFCTGPQHLLSSRLDSQEHRGGRRETASRPLPCSQRCVWVAARAAGRAGKSGSLSLHRRASVSPGVYGRALSARSGCAAVDAELSPIPRMFSVLQTALR